MRGAAFRGTRRALLVVAFVSFHCGGGDDAKYGPAEDDAFVASVTGTWSATTQSGAMLSLVICEDPSRSVCAAPTFGRASDCEEQCHVIRGGGAGASESLARGEGGCGCRGARGELGVRLVLGTDPSAQRSLTGLVDVSPEGGSGYGPVRRLFATLPDNESGRADVTGYDREGALVVEIGPAAVPAGVAVRANDRLIFRRISGASAPACQLP